jgi:LysR family transcriptional regulator, low CO2-responsive transcriptional regulator
MNITLQQLKTLQLVAQLHSITKAAEALNLTQPGVSIQLKNLQEQFDIPLFEVIGKKVHITEFGHDVIKSSEKIFLELDTIHQKSLEIKGLLGGKIKISSVSTGKYIVPYLMADFMNIHPQVEISLEVSNRDQVITQLQENSVDMALVSILPVGLQIESLPLVKNQWLLTCIPGKRDYYQNEINQGNWKKIPFILREKGSGTRTMMENFLNENNIEIGIKTEFSTNEAVKQAVMAGLGVSILSVFSIAQELEDGRIETLTFSGLPLEAEWRLIWLSQKNFQPAAKAFIGWMKNNKDIIIKDHFPWAIGSMS